VSVEAVTRFTELLDSMGIPIHGVSGNDGNARIDFKDEATPAQRSTARNEALSFDWSRRVLRTFAEVEADVQALSPAQRNALITKMLVVFCYDRPKIAQAFGISVIKASGA